MQTTTERSTGLGPGHPPATLSGWIPQGSTLFLITIFFLINVQFALKYGTRLGFSPILCALLYGTFLVLQILAAGAVTAWAVRRGRSGICLAVLLATYLAVAYGVYRSMDPYMLNSDRWSALLAFHDSMFRGVFPWTAVTHLGTNISGFPVMHMLALPFYLLGDVGLMQFAALAAFTGLMLARYRDASWPFYLLAMLLAMPAIQYEVFVRSDLLGNSILVACLMHASLRPGAARGGRLYAWAIAWGAVLATRAIYVIPLVIVAWRLVDERGPRAAIGFAAIIAAVFSATFLPFYLWDPVLFWEYNPWRIQSKYAPREVTVLVLAATLALGYFRRRSPAPFLHAGLMICLTMFICWILRAMDLGLADVVMAVKGFDLTYLSLCIPFLVIALGDALYASPRGIQSRSVAP